MPELAAPASVRDLLFADAHHIDIALRDTMATGWAGRLVATSLGPLARTLAQTALSEVAHVIASVLDMNLVDVLVGGWQRYAALTEAARRTINTPGSIEEVRLATHVITATQQPSVELLLDGTCITTIRLGLTLTWEVEALAAVVARGCLVGLHSGRCRITAALAIEGETVAERDIQSELRLIVRIQTAFHWCLLKGGNRKI